MFLRQNHFNTQLKKLESRIKKAYKEGTVPQNQNEGQDNLSPSTSWKEYLTYFFVGGIVVMLFMLVYSLTKEEWEVEDIYDNELFVW